MSQNKPEKIVRHGEKCFKESGVDMKLQQTNVCSKLTKEKLE